MQTLLLIIGLVAGNLPVSGVSAYPFPIQIIQSNGTRITIIPKGDENMKWAQTVDGYSIMRNNKGVFEYSRMSATMDMIPSGLQAKMNATEAVRIFNSWEIPLKALLFLRIRQL